MFMPFQILGIWIRGLFALVLIGGGITLLSLWYNNRQHTIVESVHHVDSSQPDQGPSATAPTKHEEESHVHTVPWKFGWNWVTAYLLGAVAMLGWSMGGGWLLSPRWWRRSGRDEPRKEDSNKISFLQRPDGTKLCVASFGPADADPLVFVHGWGLDSNEWFYAKRELSAYRIITWDLPGCGRSTRPTNRDWSLEKLANDLAAVIESAGGRQVTLVGHSIGTMIILTYCKLFTASLGKRVGRIVLAHGTYTNPVKTSSRPRLYTALQKPLLEPLCHVMVWLSPLARVLNWMSYLNGSAHRSTERDSFTGNETRGQLEFFTRLYCSAAPDVIGRGMLAMFRYDATQTLGFISVPTLIVAGENDQSCTVEASRYMAAKIPHSELVVLPTKHCGLFEQHEQFHEAIIGFLATSEAEFPKLDKDGQSTPRTPSNSNVQATPS